MTNPTPILHADCFGKEPFATKPAALLSIRERQRRCKRRSHSKEHKRSLATLSPYLCPYCHQWHVGGSYKPKKVTK